MFYRLLLPTLFTFTVFSCNSQKKPATDAAATLPTTSDKVVNSTYPTHKPDINTVRLAEKQNIFLKDRQINVTFKRTVQDSRCPMNARCIWAGNATVEIELMSTTSRPVIKKLSVGDLRGNLSKSADFGGYRFTLENLYPSNSTDIGFNKLQGKYVIDLKVDKL